MNPGCFASGAGRCLRHSPWDALLVGLAFVHGAVLLLAPSVWLIALGLWWNANAISHNFIHLPFFRSRRLNRLFSAQLSLLLGFPQSVWRARHLAHHRGAAWRWQALEPACLVEAALVLGLWLVLLATNPRFFAAVYLPGWLAGLALCQLQGHFEHARGTASHYGALYNLLFFNDGFHLEHHVQPARHWTRLPHGRTQDPASQGSRWPAVLRWLEWLGLEGLERLVLRSPALQRFVLRCHERAFRRLLPSLPPLRHATIIGGGLFPRTALILQRLAPGAQLELVDASAHHLAVAGARLAGRVDYVCRFYDPSRGTARDQETDLLVVPLAFVGDRTAIYRRPPARYVLVHDWLWRKHGSSVVISLVLLKRLNLVRQ